MLTDAPVHCAITVRPPLVSDHVYEGESTMKRRTVQRQGCPAMPAPLRTLTATAFSRDCFLRACCPPIPPLGCLFSFFFEHLSTG